MEKRKGRIVSHVAVGSAPAVALVLALGEWRGLGAQGIILAALEAPGPVDPAPATNKDNSVLA